MSRISAHLNGTVATLALFAGAMLAVPAAAQVLAANDAAPETVVVSGTAFNPDTAPAKASLDTMEPQTVINRSYIEDSVSDTADYTTILAIAPGMTGFDVNGPGLSDGGVKNTMRGLPDGSYGMSFDGIPFGDSNGPSHHSQSYFPATTIGSILVDRGPGNAGTLGDATFGGNISLFSDVLTSDSGNKVSASAGSWGTTMFNANMQTGDFELLGHTSRAMVNFQGTNSGGYITYQSSAAKNILVKTETDLGGNWTLTAFANYNALFQNLNDNAGVTPAQIVAFGKNYGLQVTNPAAGNYKDFNHVHKKTDMEYLRLQGHLWEGLSIDDTFYTYAYVNKTMSTTSVQQNLADIAGGVTEGNLPPTGGVLLTGGTIVGGVRFPSNVPGYTKQNAFRMWGNIFRASQDFDFGWMSGQLRAGLW